MIKYLRDFGKKIRVYQNPWRNLKTKSGCALRWRRKYYHEFIALLLGSTPHLFTSEPIHSWFMKYAWIWRTSPKPYIWMIGTVYGVYGRGCEGFTLLHRKQAVIRTCTHAHKPYDPELACNRVYMKHWKRIQACGRGRPFDNIGFDTTLSVRFEVCKISFCIFNIST